MGKKKAYCKKNYLCYTLVISIILHAGLVFAFNPNIFNQQQVKLTEIEFLRVPKKASTVLALKEETSKTDRQIEKSLEKQQVMPQEAVLPKKVVPPKEKPLEIVSIERIVKPIEEKPKPSEIQKPKPEKEPNETFRIENEGRKRESLAMAALNPFSPIINPIPAPKPSERETTKSLNDNTETNSSDTQKKHKAAQNSKSEAGKATSKKEAVKSQPKANAKLPNQAAVKPGPKSETSQKSIPKMAVKIVEERNSKETRSEITIKTHGKYETNSKTAGSKGIEGALATHRKPNGAANNNGVSQGSAGDPHSGDEAGEGGGFLSGGSRYESREEDSKAENLMFVAYAQKIYPKSEEGYVQVRVPMRLSVDLKGYLISYRFIEKNLPEEVAREIAETLLLSQPFSFRGNIEVSLLVKVKKELMAGFSGSIIQ